MLRRISVGLRILLCTLVVLTSWVSAAAGPEDSHSPGRSEHVVRPLQQQMQAVSVLQIEKQTRPEHTTATTLPPPTARTSDTQRFYFLVGTTMPRGDGRTEFVSRLLYTIVTSSIL